MDIDLCNLAKKLADGDISEDEFTHQRTKIIHYISQGKSNERTDINADSARTTVAAENDDLFDTFPQVPQSDNNKLLSLLVLLPVILLVSTALALLLTDTSTINSTNIPVKLPATQEKHQQLAGNTEQSIKPEHKTNYPLAQKNTQKHTDHVTAANKQLADITHKAAHTHKQLQKTSKHSKESKQPTKSAKAAPMRSAKSTPAQTPTNTKEENHTIYQKIAVKPAGQSQANTKTNQTQANDTNGRNDPPYETAYLASSKSVKSSTRKPASPFYSTPVKQEIQPTMADIQQVLAKFVDAYEKGDLDSFTSLFAKDATTNEQTDRNDIRNEYQQLFDNTHGRHMHFTNFNWDLYNGEAEGKGRFELLISPKNTATVQKYSGEVQLILKQKDNGVVISEMRHTEQSDS